MNKELLLNKIKIEDYIWLINLSIVFFALTSNNYERDYIMNSNLKAQKAYKTINIGIFIVLIIIYAYFAYNRYKTVEKIKSTSINKEVLIDEANLIASILILIGALIYLIDEIFGDKNTAVDLDLI